MSAHVLKKRILHKCTCIKNRGSNISAHVLKKRILHGCSGSYMSAHVLKIEDLTYALMY